MNNIQLWSIIIGWAFFSSFLFWIIKVALWPSVLRGKFDYYSYECPMVPFGFMCFVGFFPLLLIICFIQGDANILTVMAVIPLWLFFAFILRTPMNNWRNRITKKIPLDKYRVEELLRKEVIIDFVKKGGLKKYE